MSVNLHIKDIKNTFKIKNIPNILTITRLVLIIPIIILLELNNLSFIYLLIIIGGITDYFDGYFAKRLNIKTKFGAIIDPISDKIFIIIPLVWLSSKQIIPYWSLSLIIFREFLISALRLTKSDGLPALKLSKFKTFFFFISLIILFLPYQNDLLIRIGLIFYWISFSFTIISLINYLRIK